MPQTHVYQEQVAGANESSTHVQVGSASFDVAGVGNWISDHTWLFLLVAFVAFVFYIFQKGGFAEKFLEFRIRSQELDAKQISDVRALNESMRRKFDRPDPLLPFDEPID